MPLNNIFDVYLKLTSYVGRDNIVSEDGFVNLFNGVDLQGWSMAGRGKFRIIEQERALESEDGMGLLWYTNRMYGDFILKIDWRVKLRTDNSGVFIRFSDPGADPWNAVKTGYEIQIDDFGSSLDKFTVKVTSDDGTGTGTIVTNDGIVATCYHVIGDANSE